MITLQTRPVDILKEIANHREQKGKEKETLLLIENALKAGHDFVINLFFEKVLTYQHLVMNEDAKSADKKENLARRKALLNMEKTILEAKFFIEKYKLAQWYSRLHRFLGRLNDYKGQFEKAVVEYQKAVKFVKDDPEYKKGIPRQMELQAFLAYSTLMSGNHRKGMEMSREIYESFDETQDGKLLAEKDYFTWAVWKSGIPIRTIKALIEKEIKFDKETMLKWLKEAEKDLDKKNLDFGYRKAEIEAAKNQID